jgi:hypothetical protein
MGGVPLLDLAIDDVESNHAEAEDDGGGDLPGYVRLWRAVIANTVADATSPVPSHDRDQARAWLTTASRDHAREHPNAKSQIWGIITLT